LCRSRRRGKRYRFRRVSAKVGKRKADDKIESERVSEEERESEKKRERKRNDGGEEEECKAMHMQCNAMQVINMPPVRRKERKTSQTKHK